MTSPWKQDGKTETSFWLEFQVCHDGLTDTDSHAQNDSNAARTFHCFPDLPAELRLQIWSHLILPRVVAAACLSSLDAAQKRTRLAARPRCPPTPVLLHVNRETRDLALAHYAPTFSWKVPRVLLPSTAAVGVEPPPAPRAPARVWFNHALDALLLLGELLPYDDDGLAAPMVYFLAREEAARVRRMAVAFEALRVGDAAAEQVFGALFHVVDRFPGAERLLVTSTAEDVETARPVLPGAGGDNVVQKIWRGYINGTSVVTSSLADKQILMIAEDELAGFACG